MVHDFTSRSDNFNRRGDRHSTMRLSGFLLDILITLLWIAPVFTFLPVSVLTARQSQSRPLKNNPNGDQNEDPSPTKQQEILMEELARIGAKKIAKLSIPERTKRAMLAEAIEDRIFDFTTQLEDLLDKDGRLEEANREQAVQIASQTKVLQVQYNDLVSGNPSSVLDSFEGLSGDEEAS